VDGQVTPPGLQLEIRKDRRGAQGHAFSLGVSLDVPPGFTIVFGPSGAGKSTLLDCIAGLVRPDTGRIALGDEVLFDSAKGIFVHPEYRRVAYVFQSLALFPHLTVEQNVTYGLANLPSGERSERAAEILEQFNVSSLRTRRSCEISGGERQRVALARSLVTQPRLLLLDEPLTGLDSGLKFAILDDLRAWNAARSIPILYVTHSRDEVDALAERAITLDQGKIVSQGAPHLVLDAPRRRRLAIAAGFENLLPGSVVELREADGVMRVRLQHVELEVPLAHALVGDAVRIAIRAGDILLATERPHGLSARNVLPGRIVALDERGPVVLLQVDCGDLFQVQVTRGAARSLNLSSGAKLWLVVKTHSCHLVQG
jgi:molybdate transport system ATP-binding protein